MNKKRVFMEGMAVGVAVVLCLNTLLSFVLPIFLNTGKTMNADKKINTIYSIIDTYYVEDYKKEDLEDGMFMGLVYGLGDKYSSYMDKETFEKLTEQTEGTYTGIGAVVTDSEDGRVAIVAPYDGSPAANAGLLPKDIITEVNGIDIRNAGTDAVVTMMKGKAGTAVNLTIFRESEGRTFSVDVVRDVVTMQTVTHEMLEGNIGYIRISGFERVTDDQFIEALNMLKEDGAQGFILDVRNNPGGLLDVVVNICNELVPEGTILYTEDRQGERDYLTSDAHYLNMPIVLLVNGNSASASEVLSGAIQDYGVGILVGEQTFGKGLVQNVFKLDDGSAVKVTIARYYTPSGVCIHGVGITPDYIVPMGEELTAVVSTLSYEQDVQLQKAVEVMQQQLK